MSTICSIGSETTSIDNDELRLEISKFLDQLGTKEDVLVLPPDYTRLHSQSGIITQMIAEYYKFIPLSTTTTTTTTSTSAFPPKRFQIMPALGTHAPMTNEQIHNMFGKHLGEKNEQSSKVSPSPFLIHDWRNDIVTVGYVPNEKVQTATYGMVDQPWPVQLNKAVWEKRKSNPNKQYERNVVISVGQGRNEIMSQSMTRNNKRTTQFDKLMSNKMMSLCRE
jgi:nickel-dependent lactate racemase